MVHVVYCVPGVVFLLITIFNIPTLDPSYFKALFC